MFDEVEKHERKIDVAKEAISKEVWRKNFIQHLCHSVG
jgi:hypothetical protein